MPCQKPKEKKRLHYKERRKKWIFIQDVALALVALLILMSTLIYTRLNKEIYIPYRESSRVDCSVKIPNGAPFYSEYLDEFSQFADENGDLWIPANYAYPTMAATVIRINMDYQLNMDAQNVDYEFTYRIYAQPEIVDTATKNKFPLPKTIIEQATAPITQSSNNVLAINKPIEIDYHKYNDLVNEFEGKLGIDHATENLIITMEIEVVGSSEMFESNSENIHFINVSVPLTENAFDINYSSSVQDGDNKILARKNSGNQHLFRGASVVLGGLELLMLITFVAYVYLTGNDDVNYSIKVRRLVNSYRSFIQQVMNGFDTDGYQLLEIASFKDMLSIRDTVQSPILMSENTDQTRTQFFIPTNTKILYVFEVKIDNYDELYSSHPEWVDDSIVKFTTTSEKNAEEEPVFEQTEDTMDQDVINALFAEIARLRQEIQSTKEQKSDANAQTPPCTVTPQYLAPV